MNQTCANCRYCVLAPIDAHNLGADRQAICKRFPPVPQIIGMDPSGNPMTLSVHPPTVPGNWCGEWTQKTNAQEEWSARN